VETTPKEMRFSNGKAIQYIAYGGILVLRATSEDDARRSVTTLNRTLQLYSIKISEEKTKSIGLQGKE
jgi:hypothetical protein